MLRSLIANNALSCDRYRNALTFCLFFQQNWNWSLKFDVYSVVILAIRHCQRRRQQNRCRWSFLDEAGFRNLKRSPVASFQLQKPVYCASFKESINRFLLHSIFVFKKDKRFRSEQTHTAILLCSRKCIYVFYCETRDFPKFLCTNFSLGYLRNLYGVCICDY